jgi:hypothetical protein
MDKKQLRVVEAGKQDDPSFSAAFVQECQIAGGWSANNKLRISADNFRFARQNEAAGTADTAAWVMSAVLISGSDKLWVTRRCPCDPSTQMMLEELQRRHRYIRLIERFAQHFDCSPDRLEPQHIREYQAQLFNRPQAESRFRDFPLIGMSPRRCYCRISTRRLCWGRS